MEFRETDEHRALREAVRAMTAKFGPQYYVSHAEAGTPCEDLWKAFGDAGYLAVNLPEEYGGGGAGMVELAMVIEESAAGGCPLLLLLVAVAISGEVIAEYGSLEQKQQWLPKLADGSSRVVFAITEPNAGSNTHKLSTTARRDGDDWLINGTKYYISGVDTADAILVVTTTGRDEKTGRGELTLFLVPTDSPGLVIQDLPVALRLPEKQFTLFFDDVRVPASAVVGDVGKGFHQVFHGLNPERITGAALAVGIARHALKQAADYAQTRVVWDVPIATHQAVSHPLAKGLIEVELAALMTYKAAWLHDQGLPAGSESNMAKYAAAEAALGAIDAAMQTHGGNGLSVEYGLLPYWGLARLMRTAPVSREMILNFVAQHDLGLTRSY